MIEIHDTTIVPIWVVFLNKQATNGRVAQVHRSVAQTNRTLVRFEMTDIIRGKFPAIADAETAWLIYKERVK